MQWLTAILAFATIMLVFSLVVSTLVETIHRLLGSRSFGLRKMLEPFYADVIAPYFKMAPKAPGLSRDDFVSAMIRVRGTTAPGAGKGTAAENERADVGSETWSQSWMLMTDLPVESFMQRLGASRFSEVLDEAFAGKSDERGKALKDIAQKFELYGQEAGIYFERKARSWSVAVAMFVAWFFFIHPYDLMRTFLIQPEVAAKIAELSDDALSEFEEAVEALEDIEEAPPSAVDGDDPAAARSPELQEALRTIEAELDAARERLQPLEAAGLAIGWPEDRTLCLVEDLFASADNNGGTIEGEPGEASSRAPDTANGEGGDACWIKAPNNLKDLFWLILGGLLVGLGAPFWAKAIGQVTNLQGTSRSLARILKPEAQPQTAATPSGSSVATEAFDASASAPKDPRT